MPDLSSRALRFIVEVHLRSRKLQDLSQRGKCSHDVVHNGSIEWFNGA
jgi:hypothetical protein